MAGLSHAKMGDWIWSPAGEGEWCMLVSIKGESAGNWKYVVPSCGAVVAGAASLLATSLANWRQGETSPPSGRP